MTPYLEDTQQYFEMEEVNQYDFKETTGKTEPFNSYAVTSNGKSEQ